MRRMLLGLGVVLPLAAVPAARAQTDPQPGGQPGAPSGAPDQICLDLASHLRNDLMPQPLLEDQPNLLRLAALPNSVLHLAEIDARPRALSAHERNPLTGKGRPEAIQKRYEVPRPIAEQVAAMDQAPLVLRLPHSDVRVFDEVVTATECHASQLAWNIPAAGAPASVALTLSTPEHDCWSPVVYTGAEIGGAPALLAEFNWVGTGAFDRSEIRVARLHDLEFDPPCSVNVRFAITWKVTKFWCSGVRCDALHKELDYLDGRLDQGERIPDIARSILQMAANTTINPMAQSTIAEYQNLLSRANAAEAAHTFPNGPAGFVVLQDKAFVPIVPPDGHAFLARIGHPLWREQIWPEYQAVIYGLDPDNGLEAIAGADLQPVHTKITAVELGETQGAGQ